MAPGSPWHPLLMAQGSCRKLLYSQRSRLQLPDTQEGHTGSRTHGGAGFFGATFPLEAPAGPWGDGSGEHPLQCPLHLSTLHLINSS